LPDLSVPKRKDGIDQPAGPSGIGTIPLPGKVERADDDA
jgi:hypothetical protein